MAPWPWPARLPLIHVPVAQRIADGFTDGLEAREVDDAIDRVLASEGLIQGGGIANIAFDHGEGIVVAQLPDPSQCFRAAVAEVVQHHQVVPGVQEHQSGVAADETSAAGDQDATAHGGLVVNGLIVNQMLSST